MTDAERTPWFRCGIEDPVRAGMYEVRVSRLHFSPLVGELVLQPKFEMLRFDGRRWVDDRSVVVPWALEWRGLTAQAVPA